MFKPNLLAQAVAVALILPGVSYAEFEISGEAKIEYSVFQSDGQVTGSDSPHAAGEPMKIEPSIKLFINTDIGEESSFHAELLFADDQDAASERLEGGEQHSQYELLREFYFDTNAGSWDFRLGKQQVVWGTADGIKLLDIINPTDFRELNQNVMEDARIPVWIVNAEKGFENGGNLQLILSEYQPNFIAGLDADGDSGAPFIFKGVDSITGKENGFLNIIPALASVASSFSNAAFGGGFVFAAPAPGTLGLAPFTGLTVDGFSSNPAIDGVSINGAFLFANSAPVVESTVDESILGADLNRDGDMVDIGIDLNQDGDTDDTISFNAATATQGANILGGIAQGGLQPGDPNANNFETNLIGGSFVGPGQFSAIWDPSNPTSTFEYMPNATFSTFNTLAGTKTVYIQDYDDEASFGGRWKQTTDSGLNYSINYFNHLSANPQVNLSQHDAVTGEELTVSRCFGSPTTGLPDVTNCVSVENIPTAITVDAFGNATNAVTVLASNSDGEYYGPIDPITGGPNANTNGIVTHMVESSERVNTLGASFDMALDGTSIPVVIRGEFLYDADEKQPLVDNLAISVGDYTNALKMVDADFFKYVLGVDLTVMTNLLVSTQLIQYYNLDYIEQNRTCTTQFGVQFDCSTYTGDFSTLHLSNGLNKGDEVETFISFFLSKPFGSDVQHRWNNIIIAENDGGYWNRFDVEYSFNDEVIGTVELNNYWGDEDTTFGQFEDSSNLQLGLKVIF